ncbi:MAG: HAMP domain-containing sensor histidine kinase [Segetibacter sp.]
MTTYIPDVEEINISSLLQNMINNYQNHYNGDFPDITHNIHSDRKIIANHSLIGILLSNLVKNAVEHNQPDGDIIIILNDLELSIKNTGAEPETEPEVLFERFRKGSYKSKTTGLGLAMVKQICLLYHYPIKYSYQNGWHEVTVGFNGE